ncbi:cation transporter [Citricoccus sp.]|uniref:cation diffusion facilitator family transporter n=1 Tax=Citricoccus sp. TaxID=1978372 RepID=UPI0028BE5181|nr:cation transporter [Citricoccus sp.]
MTSKPASNSQRIGWDLPREQQEALRKAVRLEWLSLGITACTITLVALVLGNSQAMKTAWFEDMLSTIPQISFLVSLLAIRRFRQNTKRPYGVHRAAGIGHLVSSVALTLVGGFLGYEAVSGLVTAEHPTVGTVQLFGNTVWLGWIMMGVMAVIALPPVFLARAKLKVAPVLNDKVLFSDANMNKADWLTNAASIVGVAGIGLGLWWMDYAAAFVISMDILKDGVQHLRAAVLDLIDRRATTPDNKDPHPAIADAVEAVQALPWVDQAGCRVRDLGRRLHLEAFVVPRSGQVSLDQIEEAEAACRSVDWMVWDVVVMPVPRLPDFVQPEAG